MEPNRAPAVVTASAVPQVHSVTDMERMARAIAESGFFGIKDPKQAFALMLVAQAEGRHPASAAMDYHIIQGRPALKADTMLGRFQEAGGSVEWHQLDDSVADATFFHARMPKGVRISWDMRRATQAGLLGNPSWKKYPRAMLRSRCISEGIRSCYPAALSGAYTPEEVESFSLPPREAEHEVVEDARPPDASAPPNGAPTSEPSATVAGSEPSRREEPSTGPSEREPGEEPGEPEEERILLCNRCLGRAVIRPTKAGEPAVWCMKGTKCGDTKFAGFCYMLKDRDKKNPGDQPRQTTRNVEVEMS